MALRLCRMAKMCSGGVMTEELDNMAKEQAIMYNLVGHELAEVIVECDGLARNLQGMREDNKHEDFLLDIYYNETVQQTARGFKHVGATVDGIKREVDSMMLDPMTDWGESSLPVGAQGITVMAIGPQGQRKWTR
ncbi:P4Hc domain-containing protein [Durusdinium trenchii]|uniref:P4Hc domain-containing protein n=1 Tax=Durusdinium trenchii TaxID=1381693 RepID=A0ABP0JFS0_9DINO